MSQQNESANVSANERRPLDGRHIALGVCGSIAAFKAADLCSKLRQAGAEVEVIMTPAATQFVTPLTFQSLSGRDVVVDMFTAGEPEAHVEVARRADALVIAPATADCLANLAHGQTPDMVTLTALATSAPVLVAPAMDNQMWEHAATQANLEVLRSRRVTFAGPVSGRLASGRMGAGRMAEVPAIVGALRAMLGAREGDLRGRHIVVSAGGTREAIDPVRFISNRSSGKMGYAIAEAARDQGARVTLVSTVEALPVPYGVDIVAVASVAEMRRAILAACADADVLVMAAAVSDFTPSQPSQQKIKKGGGGLTLELAKNASFLPEVPDSVLKVGFAAETQDVIENARRKPLSHGRLDLICANDVSASDAGFAVDTNRVTIIDPADGSAEELPLMSKYAVGQAILGRVAARLAGG
jgi:phosphopantothenoylcysteine decarboxylase/phosphopantothenate--cysteine ligase